MSSFFGNMFGSKLTPQQLSIINEFKMDTHYILTNVNPALLPIINNDQFCEIVQIDCQTKWSIYQALLNFNNRMKRLGIRSGTPQYGEEKAKDPTIVHMYDVSQGWKSANLGGKKRRTKRRRSTKKNKTHYKKRRHTNRRS
jgi:hypothetical protein